ncbi:MAG: cupin domain-containing protein [Roseobacter sp.]|jgi:ethanolamine utilization protein EutQ (cupin superfamily)|nr:cupin domain-containing protein [Roseobacter sp.]
MSINLLELSTIAGGEPSLTHSEVELRSSGRDLIGDQATMSAAFGCRNMVFISFPVGFKSSNRTPDRAQFAVILQGQLKVSAGDEDSVVLEPGGVLHIPKAEISEHTLEVVGPECVTLMIVLE